MQKQIVGIRYFEKEEYARDFVEGRIFFNSAGVYENIGNDVQQYFEGRVPYFSNEIKIDGIPLENVVSYTLWYEEDKRVPICCFSYMTPKDIFNGEFHVNNLMKNTYNYFVVFNIGDLLDSLSKKLCNAGCGLCARPVEYFDFSDKTNPWSKVDFSEIPVHYRKFFIHDKKEEYQKEFRIVITHKLFDYGGANTKIDITNKWSSVPLRICQFK